MKYGDTIEITGQNQQHSFEIGQRIVVKRVIPLHNAVEEFWNGISIWILPEDYKVIKEE